ncbi:MAG: PKD domain-containing protein [Aggregatilineales bacterium]
MPHHGSQNRANTNPSTVGSVRLNLTGALTRVQTESGAPYALFSDNGGNYANWAPVAGTYTLTATPYSGTNAGGMMGIPRTISFTIEAPSLACGGLVQEAENGILGGTFVVGTDATASGGQYVHAPEGSGSRYSPNSPSLVTLCFNVAEAGTYQLRGWVQASDGSSDTFFVTVNGSTFLWDLPTTASFVQDYMNDLGVADPVQVTLPTGNVEIIVRLREDGARLDKLELVPVGVAVNQAPVANAGTYPNPIADTNTVPGENVQLNGTSSADVDGTIASYAWTVNGVPVANTTATPTVSLNDGANTVSLIVTDNNGAPSAPATVTINVAPYVPTTTCSSLIVEAETGVMSGNFVVGNDTNASGGQYAHTPDGSGSAYSPNSSSHVTLCFNVAEAGTYQLRGWVWANNGESNSFFVTVNGANFLWDIPVNTR